MMSYKAIVFDLDGTAIPNKKDGVPSQYLIDTIQKVKDKVYICAATGRRIFDCRNILKSLRLTSPCIILGGTQIIDPVSEKILWEKLIPEETVKQVIEVVKMVDYQLYLSNEMESSMASDKLVNNSENIIYIMNVNKNDTKTLLNQLKEIPEVAAHSVPSHSQYNFDIHITHKEATKKHSLEILFEMLRVDKEEVIGFGDGNNDLPIFESVGYRVAMDNASQDLKAMSDLIAASAEEDGVAKVIEKLIV